jgi:hypothetical protein
MNVDKPHYTAHELPRATIAYRYHPFHGEPVEILRRFRRYATDHLLLRLSDEVQLAIPAWMLDPVACQELCNEVHPRIAVSALQALQQLLESQPLLATNPAATSSRASEDKGGTDARLSRTSPPTTPTSLPAPRSLGPVAGGDPAPVSDTLPATAADRLGSRNTRKDIP